jgi:hypothetical protein
MGLAMNSTPEDGDVAHVVQGRGALAPGRR